MFSKIRPAHGVAVGVAIASALALLASYIAEPLSVPAATSIPDRASARFIEVHASILTDSPMERDLSPSPPGSSADRANRGILLARQCLALAERDPLAAMEMAVANQIQDVDPGIAFSLIAQWARQDFGRAYEWTKSQEPSAWREDMLARLVYLRAKADPVAAARLIATDMSAGPNRDEAVISVIHQWALRDARGAGLWALSLPDETLRLRASEEIANLTSASSSAKTLR